MFSDEFCMLFIPRAMQKKSQEILWGGMGEEIWALCHFDEPLRTYAFAEEACLTI